MATGNPALSESYFETEARSRTGAGVMTVQGTAIKTLVLTGIMCAVAAFAWGKVFPEGVSAAHADGAIRMNYGGSGMGNSMSMNESYFVNRTAMMGFMVGGGIGGLVLGLILCFAPKAAPVLAPLYAACEGAFLGAVSGIYAVGNYPGIVMQAGMLTVGVLVMMLALYGTRIIVVTNKLRTGIIAATGALMLVYLGTMVARMFGVNVPHIYDNGLIGIGFSGLVVVLAAFNLVLDFDTIENGARYRAPKYMEWYGAYGLLVTLVWLYMEILRLLSKLNSRD